MDCSQLPVLKGILYFLDFHARIITPVLHLPLCYDYPEVLNGRSSPTIFPRSHLSSSTEEPLSNKISIAILPSLRNMKTTAEKFPSDSQGDGGSDGVAKAQPSDPSKISIASAKNITDGSRLWQIVLNLKEDMN